MPLIRTPNGVKQQATPARLALAITQAYEKAHGGAVVKYRRAIQEHALRTWKAAETQLGAEDHDEWDEKALWGIVAEDLQKQASSLVHGFFKETFLGIGRRAPDTEWGMFEAQPVTLDPKWSIRWAVPKIREPETVTPAAGPKVALPWEPQAALQEPSEKVPVVALNRSDWKRLWETEAQTVEAPPNIEGWFRDFWQHERDQKTLDAEGWWLFWHERLEAGMGKDPRLAQLLARMTWRKALSAASGDTWLNGTVAAGPRPLLLRDAHAYREAALEHLRKVRTQAGWKLSEHDLATLVRHIQPDRDLRLTWPGWISLQQQGALWVVDSHPAARELPQWMWMRSALALCQGESDFSKRVLQAYDAFSFGRIVPSEAMMRQAGKSDPQFLEDQAGWVEDDFERIYQAIHRAAVDTKWNGAVSLDWSRVRPKGAAAAAGRSSAGVVGFLQAISMALSAQGRHPDERPVTALLPLWHGDVIHFMDAVDKVPHIQPVLAIPDLFFRRVREQGAWYLFDPSLFPEALMGDDGIVRAEERARQLRVGQQRVPGVRVVKAQGLWGRLLRCVSTHAPSLVFPSSVQAFFPYGPTLAPVMGRDGIGALPLPKEGQDATTRWPSLAVNLAALVNDEGLPDHGAMQATSELALRLLDNAIEASGGQEIAVTQSRPVCMGLVGLYETLAKISVDEQDAQLTGQWMESLAKAWNLHAEQADRLLAQERGAATIWGVQRDHHPSAHEAVERLRELREGELGLALPGGIPESRPKGASRFSVRTLWAPFLDLARIAGVTPGGFGTLHPVDSFTQDDVPHQAPSAFLMHTLRSGKVTPEQAGKVMAFPHQPQRWPKAVRAIVYPDQEQWRIRLNQAAAIRPHADQGVSLSLPHHLDKQMCGYLIYSAWWLGLSNVLFVIQRRPEPDAELQVTDQELDT